MALRGESNEALLTHLKLAEYRLPGEHQDVLQCHCRSRFA